MQKSFLHIALALGCVASAASFAAAPRAGTGTTPAYKIELHEVGSGGKSEGDEYTIEGTAGQWSVNIVKLSSPQGFALEGGIWPGIVLGDCTNPNVKFTADLSACH
jgi:hypothetical protein